jgi:hypothetical protein
MASDFQFHRSLPYFLSQNRVEFTGNKHQSPVEYHPDYAGFYWSPLDCTSHDYRKYDKSKIVAAERIEPEA